jgi:hypothetical protein
MTDVNSFEQPPPPYVMYQSDEWTALYVNGRLDRVGDSYLADERLRELVGCVYIQDNAYLRGGNSRDGVAQTLDEVTAYQRVRADREARAEQLRNEAARLLQEAEGLDGRRYSVGKNA